MKEKRFKKKALSALGIAAVLAIGVGLLTAYATSSATARVSVGEQEGIAISTGSGTPVNFCSTFGFGREHRSTDNQLWTINSNPNGKAKDFRLTITEHGSLNDALYKFEIENTDNITYTVYSEDNTHDNTFWLNPGSGSTTIYVQADGNESDASKFEVRLVSVSWAKTPFSDSDDTSTLVASGKALE